MTRSPSYLSRNKYSYCFYFRVPNDVRRHFGKKELRYSLRTGYLSEAKHRARLLAGLIQKLIHHLRNNKRNMNLTAQEIAEILDAFKDTAIKPYISWNADQAETNGTPGITEMYGDLLTRIANLEMVLKSGPERESWITSKLDSLLEGMQYDLETEIDKQSPQYRELCRKVLRASMENLQQEKNRIQDEYPELELGQVYGKQLGSDAAAAPTSPPQTSQTLEQAYQDFWDEYSGTWKPRSLPEYESLRKHILKSLGPKTQIHTLNYTDLKKFRNGLISGKLSASGNPLSIDRVNFIMKTIAGIYDLAMRKDRSLDRVNPAEGLRLRDKRKSSEKQDPFTIDELKLLFCESREYGQNKHRKAPNFWVPLLGLFTGARLEEICQLLIDDVVQKDGVWCMEIREDNAERKSVKTGKRRIVPLHPFLVDELRFPEYTQGIAPSKERVFHELPYVKHRWGHGTSQWFTKFRNRAKVTAPPRRKTFHSFRHTFITRAAHLKVPWDMRLYITGHSMGSDEQSRTYLHDPFDPGQLLEEVVSKIDFHTQLDLSHLKQSKFVVK